MTIFRNLFKPKKELPPVDLGLIKTDMHSHLLPGIDDGATDTDNSLALISKLIGLGFTGFITTPHIMSDFYRNTPEIIQNTCLSLNKVLEQQHKGLIIRAASEYYIDYDFANNIRQKELLTFGSNYILVEISYLNEPDILPEVLFELQARGLKPVLAHPERYPFWFRKFEKYQDLKDREVFFQVNINSLCGYYGPESRMIANKLIDNNMVDFVGTDCHNLKHTEALEKALTEPAMHKLTESGRLLNHTL